MFRKIILKVLEHEKLTMVDDPANVAETIDAFSVSTQTRDITNVVTQTGISEHSFQQSPLTKQNVFADFLSVVGVTKNSDHELVLSGYGDIMRYSVSFDCSVEILDNIPVMIALVVDDKIYGNPMIIYNTDEVSFSDVVIVSPPYSFSRLSIHANQQLRTLTRTNRYVATLSELPVASSPLSTCLPTNTPQFSILRVANISIFPIL